MLFDILLSCTDGSAILSLAVSRYVLVRFFVDTDGAIFGSGLFAQEGRGVNELLLEALHLPITGLLHFDLVFAIQACFDLWLDRLIILCLR